MAKRTASAKKQARSGARRSARNRGARSEVKTLVVKARRALSESGSGSADRAADAMAAIRGLDRAASKGVLHKNNAARRKARLARRLAKAATSTAPASTGKGKKTAAPARSSAPSRSSAPAKKK